MKYFVLDVTLIAINSYYLWHQVNLLPVRGVIRKQSNFEKLVYF